MRLRSFTLDDWPWVQKWFEDPVLDRELGPMDSEWLAAVLSERDGAQLVAEIDGQPVALIGCVWDPEHRHPHAITDLAVAPDQKRRGIGARALEMVLACPELLPARSWIAHVAMDNASACAFFQKLDWRDKGIVNGMRRFAHPAAPART